MNSSSQGKFLAAYLHQLEQYHWFIPYLSAKVHANQLRKSQR
jgi:hypothetical protein